MVQDCHGTKTATSSVWRCLSSCRDEGLGLVDSKATKYSQSVDYVRTTDLALNPSRPHATLYYLLRVASAQTSGTIFQLRGARFPVTQVSMWACSGPVDRLCGLSDFSVLCCLNPATLPGYWPSAWPARVTWQGAWELLSPKHYTGLVTFSISLVAQDTAIPWDKKPLGLTSLRSPPATLIQGFEMNDYGGKMQGGLVRGGTGSDLPSWSGCGS